MNKSNKNYLETMLTTALLPRNISNHTVMNSRAITILSLFSVLSLYGQDICSSLEEEPTHNSLKEQMLPLRSFKILSLPVASVDFYPLLLSQ